MTTSKRSYIEQKIAGIDEPMLTVRPRYVQDQLDGFRGRRSRFRLISPTSAKNIQASGLSNVLRQELSAGSKGKGFTSMLIQSISYQFVEKTQINETFGDSITVYAFGMAPLVLNIQGIVVDDLDNNWFIRLIHVYQDFIRATKLAKHFEIARLDMPDASYLGSVLSLSINRDSTNDAVVGFNMQFLVRNYQFYSNQVFDEASIKKEKSLESVAKDGSFSLKTLKDKKIADELLKKFGLGDSGEVNLGVTGESSTSKLGALKSMASKAITKAGSKAITDELDKQVTRLGNALSLKGLFGKGLAFKVSDQALANSRTYKLTIVGAYSRELASAQQETTTTSFLAEATQYISNVNGTVNFITGQGLGTSEAEAKKKSLTKAFDLSKKILDLAKGKRTLNIDSIGELGEVGKSLKGTLGKVAGLPTNLADGIGNLVQNSPLSRLPIVGSVLGGVAADQAEKYFRTKIPQKTSDFLKIPAQEPTKSRVIRIGLGPLAGLLDQ